MAKQEINTRMGTKWFIFFSKVRPIIMCVGFNVTLMDFLKYMSTYLQNWWMLLIFASTLAQVVLGIITFVKSMGNYVSFVSFVEKVLVFEIFHIAYYAGTNFYLQSGLDIRSAAIAFMIALAIAYFVWYRLNVKYFNDRIVIETDEDTKKFF